MDMQTKEYIKFLENKLSMFEDLSNKKMDYNNNPFIEKDSLLTENKRLWDENNRLIQTIIANNLYINYLSSSKWWKLSYPIRRLTRLIKHDKKNNYITNKPNNIKDKVSIIIFSYNNESLTELLIDNINKQEKVSDKEILIVTRNTKEKDILIKKNIKYINLKDENITNDQAYIKVLPYIDSKYIAIIDQNTIINTNDWLYKSLVPIINGNAIASLFFDEDIKFIKETYVYPDLKNRIYKINNNNLLLLPLNRDLIEYISPLFIGRTNIIVKKRISNYYMI